MLLEMTRAAQTGLRQERQYEIVSNHLANSNTTGFKKDILTFDQMMKAELTTDFSQGDLQLTGNKLDLALTQDGFFKVETTGGDIRYTRNGNFSLDTEGLLINSSGDTVLGEGGPVTIPEGDIFINNQGQVFSNGEDVDNLQIVDFDNKALLEKEGRNYFVYKGDPIDERPAEQFQVKQGALESANIGIVYEMTKMVETHRLYDTAQRVMRTVDELDGQVNTMGAPK